MFFTRTEKSENKVLPTIMWSHIIYSFHFLFDRYHYFKELKNKNSQNAYSQTLKSTIVCALQVMVVHQGS